MVSEHFKNYVIKEKSYLALNIDGDKYEFKTTFLIEMAKDSIHFKNEYEYFKKCLSENKLTVVI